ncbi:MGMT family protein [Alcanivorax sp. JB21]|uniref:MGMT family protein n=1 Tax=Alcanivorax limicola TaxID=2874102 RepID=UPI001CC016C1|nr:MGMT family protein [Alcanivorax limicola]MBZ2189701.1 MGMT family protein [Alcanivorax limicola]
MTAVTDPESGFARAVYLIVASIPAGRVCAYGRVAALAGYPRHARHVGKLMARLPAGSSLPWYRVVRADGRLPVGMRQQQLLVSEDVAITGERVSLRRYGWPD